MEVTELAEVENHRYILKPLLRYNSNDDEIIAAQSQPTFA
jgi:hypothetical protein